ncbi:MAG TPA: hypothetical protein VEL76_36750 [Gemmataceae bacterium]|nr:hypothetical protein [Gemmataceae bacterium]
MAKPLGPKSVLIRDAIKANPDKGNTAIAELLNDAEERMDDKIKVTATDVATQRQALKKAGEAAPVAAAAKKPAGKKKGGRPRRTAAQPQAAATPQSATQTGPVDLIDKTLDLAAQAGGVAALKRLVDRLADMQKW